MAQHETKNINIDTLKEVYSESSFNFLNDELEKTLLLCEETAAQGCLVVVRLFSQPRNAVARLMIALQDRGLIVQSKHIVGGMTRLEISGWGC
jgi:hypothetical protein